MEDNKKKRTKARLAVRIMSPENGIFSAKPEEPDQMISMKNLVYEWVFGDTAG